MPQLHHRKNKWAGLLTIVKTSGQACSPLFATCLTYFVFSACLPARPPACPPRPAPCSALGASAAENVRSLVDAVSRAVPLVAGLLQVRQAGSKVVNPTTITTPPPPLPTQRMCINNGTPRAPPSPPFNTSTPPCTA